MKDIYCEQISDKDFVKQKETMSEVALSDLLTSVLQDETMSETDKLKWTKQVNSSLHLPAVKLVNFLFLP